MSRISATARTRLGLSLTWICLLFLFVPMLVVLPVSVTDKAYLSLPTDGMSWQHYGRIIDLENGWTRSFLNSFVTAICTAVIATTIAAAFAAGAWIRAGWWPSTIRILMLSPLIVPPIIYAVGIVKVLSKLSMLDSFFGVLTVHVVLALPMALLAVVASLSNLDHRMVMAARSLGAKPATIFGRVILPNIVPGLAAAGFLSFITSWDEITVTLFVAARRFVTLPRQIFTSIADNIDPALAAIASVLLVVTTTALVVRLFFSKRPDPAQH